MKRSSDSPAVSAVPSGALHVAHASQHAHALGPVKVREKRRTAAQCLRDARVKLGWTIGRAATNFGVTARVWSGWERGVRADADALAWIEGVARDFSPPSERGAA